VQGYLSARSKPPPTEGLKISCFTHHGRHQVIPERGCLDVFASGPNEHCKFSVLRNMEHEALLLCPETDHSSINFNLGRRGALRNMIFIAGFATSGIPSTAAEAFGRERSQLEFCLVNVLRTKYWANFLSFSLTTALNDKRERARDLFLEARLGSKAILTQKVGGGANIRVYNLAGLKLKDCLNDSVEWYDDFMKAEKKRGINKKTISRSKRDLQEAVDDIIYALGSCVEFDGLESVTDASPRSSLTLSMYTTDKATFVKRTLDEKLIPSIESFLGFFDKDLVDRCRYYVQQNYPNEFFDVDGTS
jgi:hypothetical protein